MRIALMMMEDCGRCHELAHQLFNVARLLKNGSDFPVPR
jgi:hypothetical protein